LRANLFNEIELSNAVEHEVFEQLVHALWQLECTRALEDFSLTQLLSDPTNPQFRKITHTSKNPDKRSKSSVAVDCNTRLTTQTEANVPALLNLQQILPANERQPKAQHLSMCLARLKNPNATYTPPELAAEKLKARAA